MKKWQTLRSKLVFDHRWYRLRQDEVILPDGQIVDDYFVSLRPDIATVLPITPEGEIVFVRQYRHGVGEILLELPAGTFEAGEVPLAVAQRELAEETGYASEQWSAIATLYSNPVNQNNKTYLFRAEAARLVQAQKLDLTEEIEVVLKPIAEVPGLIASGQICVSGSVAAIALGLPDLLATSKLTTSKLATSRLAASKLATPK